jgi:hypothetical protein
MRPSFAAASIAATLLIPSADAVAQLQSVWVTAVDDGTTLRACPDAKCGVAGKLPAGATVLVLREERGWYWVDAERFRSGGRIQNTWVRVEDVRAAAAAAAAPEKETAKAGPLWKDADVAPDKVLGPAGPATSEKACLTCAAPKRVAGSIRLTEDGPSADGPGPGDPTYDANLVLGQKKFGPRLLEAQKQATQARMNVSLYLQRCYEKYVPPDDHINKSVNRPATSAQRKAVRWGLLASASSPYAWNDTWVVGYTLGNQQTRRYCGDLWRSVQEEAGDIMVVASDITSRAIDAKIYPRAIDYLLVAYNVK